MRTTSTTLIPVYDEHIHERESGEPTREQLFCGSRPLPEVVWASRCMQQLGFPLPPKKREMYDVDAQSSDRVEVDSRSLVFI